MESNDQYKSQRLLNKLVRLEKNAGDIEAYCVKLCAEKHLSVENIPFGSAVPVNSYNAGGVQEKANLAKQYLYLKKDCPDAEAMRLIKGFVSAQEFWGAQASWTARLTPPTGIKKIRASLQNDSTLGPVVLANIKKIIAERGKKVVWFCGLFTSNSQRSECTVNFYESVEAAERWQDLCGSILLSAPELGMSDISNKSIPTFYQAAAHTREAYI